MLKMPGQLADEARRSIPEIQVDEVRKSMDAGKLPYLLLDVREPNEHSAGMIPHAVAMPRGVIEVTIQKMLQDEHAPIVCYCGGGTRSLFACEQLQRIGYKNVKSMAGGYRAWTTGGNPVVK